MTDSHSTRPTFPTMAGAVSLWRREATFLTAMLASETGIVGLNILFKAATSKGLNSYSFLGYSYLLASLLLSPSHLFSNRFLITLNLLTIGNHLILNVF